MTRSRAHARRLLGPIVALPLALPAVSGAKTLPPDIWPECAPLCAPDTTTGPHITAIYVTTQHTPTTRPLAVVDVFAAGIARRSVTGRLCYQARGFASQPGCSVNATIHARRLGGGSWWMHFILPIYQRRQITVSTSHALVRSYWFGVFVTAGNIDINAAHAGTFTQL